MEAVGLEVVFCPAACATPYVLMSNKGYRAAEKKHTYCYSDKFTRNADEFVGLTFWIIVYVRKEKKRRRNGLFVFECWLPYLSKGLEVVLCVLLLQHLLL